MTCPLPKETSFHFTEAMLLIHASALLQSKHTTYEPVYT